MQAIIFLFLSIFLDVLANLSNRNADATRGCHCVARAMCEDNDVPISEGEGLFDVRSYNKEECRKPNEICCENFLFSPSRPSLAGTCGIQTMHPSRDRTTGHSKTAQFGEAPWTVLVLEKNFIVKTYVSRCGGSLIHPQVVMTAAHCVNVPKIVWVIRVGDWNIHSRKEPLPHHDRAVQGIYIHPFYNASSLKYDVALLVLEEPVEFADNVRAICLPPPEIQLQQVKCLVSGWGKERPGKGKYPSILKLLDLSLVEHQDCQRALRNTRLGKFFHLHKSFLCAGGELKRDACRGDGGSPLVCPVPGQPGRYVQLGIVSWGIGCGENNTPGVYVNVPQIRRWVDEQLTHLNFDISSYIYD